MPPKNQQQATEKVLEQHLKYWQPRLNIRDWQIDLKVVRSQDMPAGTLG